MDILIIPLFLGIWWLFYIKDESEKERHDKLIRELQEIKYILVKIKIKSD